MPSRDEVALFFCCMNLNWFLIDSIWEFNKMSEILVFKRGVCFFKLRFKKGLHEEISRLLIVIPFLSCILCYLHTLKKRLLILVRIRINRLTRNQFGWGKGLKGSVRGVGNGVDPSTSCLVGNSREVIVCIMHAC